jgi:uncharacterized protein
LIDSASDLALSETRNGLVFWIHVTPRAKHPKVAGLHGDALRVAVAAAPVEGQANAACRDALANALGCKRIHIEIDPASKGRRKRVQVTGDAGRLRSKLYALASPPRLG